MPLVDLADAIVSSGRDTLQRAIDLVNSNAEWRAKVGLPTNACHLPNFRGLQMSLLQVVYGDTDSMFVHLPGRSRAEAFRIGAKIAAAVTAANPKPVKLQLEKVCCYSPELAISQDSRPACAGV